MQIVRTRITTDNIKLGIAYLNNILTELLYIFSLLLQEKNIYNHKHLY